MSAGVKKLAQVVVGAVVGFAQGGPWGAAIGAGLAFYAAEQQEKLNTKSPLRDNEPSAQTVRSSKAPVRFILGRVATGGVLVWAQEQSGNQADGEWLHMVYVLSEGAIDSLENIYLGEEEIGSFGAFASYELIVNPTQVNAFLKTNCPGWKDSQIGRGLSFVRVSLRYSAEKFPSGIPDARFVVKGRKDIFDPRTGATGYSANTALHILWYLRARCGVPDDEIAFSTFASAANVCDETVTNADGSVSQRYRTACVIGADEQRTGVLQKLEAACAGKLIRVGGRWMLQAGAYYGPHDFELTEDMVVGTITGSTEPANDAAINVVRGTFVDPSQSWTETDYPEVRVDQWVIEDGGEAAETLTFSYVTDPYQCQRLANIELRRRRAGGTINIPMNLSGYNCRPGRVIRVNLPSLNILGEFIVTNWSMGDKEGCSVSVAQYEQPIFSDAVGQPYNPIGFINLPAGGLGSPTNLRWVPVGSAEVTQGVLSWLPPTGIVKEYVVIVRQGGIAIQSHNVPATSTSCTINGLASGSYTMSVAAVGPMARSGETSISVNVNGPPIPEACVVQSSIDSITLIPSNTLRGLNGGTYEYFFSTVPQSDPKDAVYVGQGLSFTHTGLGFFTNYYYFVRSSNAYGKSAFLYVPASTSNDVGAYLDALDGKLTESQLGQELLGRIDLIDGPPTLPGSVSSRLKELDDQVGEVTDQLQEQIDQVSAIANSAEYQKEKAYAAGASTRLGDRLYQAKIAVPVDLSGAKAPPNSTYWLDVGQVVSDSNGLAARVSTTETKITNIEGVNTAQGTSITGLQTSLTTTNGNVIAAQTAANAASTLAGGKGKVLVQTATPAAADQLVQNLWIDITGGANTPKRWSGSAWAAVTDKIATDAAAAAANALAVANTKADSSAVISLTSRVTSAEDTITSQGAAITGLNNSLTTTNGNVTAAQNAANAANTLAGGKGKVIVQTAAPAAADQLAQNLWIDITGGANTPKRWSGSAWAAVTDKVATDAAAAAAVALSQVATKAEAATVQALSNAVTQQGATLTAQGQALTSVQTSIGGIGAAGTNLLVDTYSWLTSTTLPPVGAVTGLTLTGTAVSSAISGFGYRAVAGDTATNKQLMLMATNSSAATANIALEAGTYLVSFYASASVSGHQIQAGLWDGSVRLGANVTLTTARVRYTFVCVVPVSVTGAVIVYVNRSGVSGREVIIDSVMVEKAAGANTGTSPSPFVAGNSAASVAGQASATSALDARVTQTESGLTSQAGQITSLNTSVAGKADNSALQSLASAVSQQGTTLTSQGTAVTQLQSTVGAIGGNGINLLPGEYTAFTASPPTLQKVSTTVVTTEADATAYTGYTLKVSATATTVGYVHLASSSTDYNLKLKPGKKYIFSLKAKGSVAHNVGVRIRYLNAAGGVIEAGVGTIAVGTDLASYSAVVTAPAALVERALVVLFTQNTAVIGDTWIDAVMLEAQVGAATTPSEFTPGASVRQAFGQATALGSLDTRVTDTEGQISVQANKLDGIFAQVNPALAGDSGGFAGSTTGFVGVWSEQSARIEAGILSAKRTDTVEATANIAVDLGQQGLSLGEQNSTAVQQVSAVVQQVSQAQITADGKASAMWSVKLQVNAQGQYVAAGVGLGIENGPAGLQSSFLVSADTFAVVNGINGTLSSPFAVTGGQVFIRSAFIQDLSVSFGKIADNIQSDNYVANSTGWKLSKAGGMELNSTVAGQGRVQVTNRAVKVWDANGILRVQLGDLAA